MEKPIICTAPNTKEEEGIVALVSILIQQDSLAIYNCKNGADYSLPDVRPLETCFAPIPEGEQFDGWLDFEKITMYLYGPTPTESDKSFEHQTLNQPTIDLLNEQRNDGAKFVCAIIVQCKNGDWYEYIIRHK